METVTLLDKTWSYRGEGGANLVISLPEDRDIVRFAKSKYADKDTDNKIVEIAYFANEVMRPLLGSLYVRPLRIGVVNNQDFDHVRTEVQPFRPPNRCVKDVSSKRVILSPDCVFLTGPFLANTTGPTFSFEIKPKQGWHSLKASCSVDLCHRCLKQYAKLYQGEIDSISKYCPLDLFSGDKTRMKRAIFDLYENPCNRFKMFKDGELVYTDNIGSAESTERELNEMFFAAGSCSEEGGKDHLAALLCTALLHPWEDVGQAEVDAEYLGLNVDQFCRNKVCDTNSHPLPKNGILQKILTLQRHTEISDHDAKKICDKLLSSSSNPPPSPSPAAGGRIIETIEKLHQIVLWKEDQQQQQQPNLYPEQEKKISCSTTARLSPQEVEDVVQLRRFLLSVTAKDVSLLLTFRELEDPSLESLATPVIYSRELNKHFRVMISVIDLDPKSVHRISSWVKRKEQWLRTYFSVARKDSSSSTATDSKISLRSHHHHLRQQQPQQQQQPPNSTTRD